MELCRIYRSKDGNLLSDHNFKTPNYATDNVKLFYLKKEGFYTIKAKASER
jgi:hypothetical protein